MLWDILLMSAAGSFRAVLALPIEHPLEYLKTRMQDEPDLGARKILTHDIKNHGILRLYRGVVLNAAKETLRQGYRFPMMVSLPIGLENRLEISYGKANVLAGLLIAFIESYIICPLERMKVWVMTSPKGVNLASFFQQTHLIAQMYKGLNPVIVKQVTSWVSFLSSNAYFRQSLRRSDSETLSLSSLLLVAVGTALVNIPLCMPLDFIKTNNQKFHESNLPMFQVLLTATKHRASFFSKVKCVYSGSSIRFIHFISHALFTLTLLDRFEAHMRRKWFDSK